MDTTHTPGPWYTKPAARQPQIASEQNGRTIAIVYDHCADPEKEANARLIANAPEMRDFIDALLDTVLTETETPRAYADARALLATIDGTDATR